MFWEKFCEEFELEVKNFKESGIKFYYRDEEGDETRVDDSESLKIFLSESESKKPIFLFLKKYDNAISNTYDEIIKNEKIKNFSITVVLEEEGNKDSCCQYCNC